MHIDIIAKPDVIFSFSLKIITLEFLKRKGKNSEWQINFEKWLINSILSNVMINSIDIRILSIESKYSAHH